nr:hypothetical protein [Clostridia bacterium]
MRKAPLFLLVMGLMLGLALCQLLLPGREMSDMENRMLAGKPQLSLGALWDGTFMNGAEDFAADQLPGRDGFVALYTVMQRALGRRAVGDAVLGDGMLFDQSDDWSERNVRLNAAALAELAEITGKPVHLLAVPSAAAVYPERLPAQAPVADEAALLAAAEKETMVLPLLPALLARKDAALYYATDHHWTVAGARVGYEVACAALKLEAEAKKPAVSMRGFYGSFYARYPLPWVQADTFSYVPYENLRLTVNGEEKQGILDADALAGRDKYAALLYGNHALIELHNNAAQGTLLVIKDSYANALLPALAQHYSRVIAVDPRYFAGNIVDLVNEYEGDAILCVYGMNTLAAGRTIALLEGL